MTVLGHTPGRKQGHVARPGRFLSVAFARPELNAKLMAVVFCFKPLRSVTPLCSGGTNGAWVNPNSFLVGALLLGCIGCSGQTNACADAPVKFFVAPVQLRPEAKPELGKTEQNGLMPTASPSAAQVTALETSVGSDDFHSRVVRAGEFYLMRTEPRSDNPVVRFVDGVFTPEVVTWAK